MTRFKAVVSYDGYDYAGWQIQPAERGMTIQQAIEDALLTICQKKTGIVGSGRTDAGVHARGQVFHFDTELSLSEERWKRALNGHLPKDIHICSMTKTAPDFHARFDAVGKCYEYLIHLGELDVFSRRYAFQCPWALDVQAMRQAADVLTGTHDFSSFCANSLQETPDQIRTLSCLNIEQEEDWLRCTFIGSGFLRYMVRMLTGTLIEVGRGRLKAEDVRTMLEARDKQICHWNARPQGLTLKEVYYPDQEKSCLF